MDVTVGIIGSKGRYGVFLERLFREFGCTVIGSDARDGGNTSSRNQEVVAHSDVVIFSIPPRSVLAGDIERLVPYAKYGQLWMDITSVKVRPVQAMLRTHDSVNVVGLHPMCAPTVESLLGQTLVVCPARLNTWSRWVKQFLDFTGATLKYCRPEDHDRPIAIVQGMIHATHLVMAATVRSLGFDVNEVMSFASPLYKIALSLMARILKQDPALYADIQMCNPYVATVLAELQRQLYLLRSQVASEDRADFVESFMASRAHFTPELDKGYDLFEHLNQMLADQASQHQVRLRIAEDRTGVLYQIAGVLSDGGINLRHLHSFRDSKGELWFLVGLDRPETDAAVQTALQRIAELGLATV